MKKIFILISSLLSLNFLLAENSSDNLFNYKNLKHKVNLEYLDLPTLETSSLILRKLMIEDAKDMFEFTSDPEVEICDPVDSCLDETKSYIQSCIEKYKNLKPAPWAIFHKQDKKVIGYCGFLELDPKNSRCKIIYGISKDYKNRGLMGEALEVVFEFSFASIKINRIEAHTHLDKKGSGHLLEEIGMKPEGVLHEYEYTKDGFENVKLYAILREHYLKSKSLK